MSRRVGEPLSEETKKKISEAKTGTPRTPETKKKISEGLRRTHEKRRQNKS